MKKNINVLIIESKPESSNLMKKTIEDKPDKKYNIQVTGLVKTAKAGYFEIYKNKPHVLLLNPDLPDEDGLSFIKHALERLPQLKILPMLPQVQDKSDYLAAGAWGVIDLPIQRAAIWRRMDELAKELDETGVLEHFQHVESPFSKEEGEREIKNDLFSLNDPTEKTFNPIFDDTAEQEGQTEDETDVDSEEVVVPIPKAETEEVEIEQKETPFHLLSDEGGVESEDVESGINSEDELSEDNEQKHEQEQTSKTENIPFFVFDDEADSEELEPEVNQDNVELKTLNPSDESEKSKQSNRVDRSIEEREAVGGDPKKTAEAVPSEDTRTNIFSVPRRDSNTPRTTDPLYLETNEYNKETDYEKRAFKQGFHTKSGDFVPLYPPVERFQNYFQQ